MNQEYVYTVLALFGKGDATEEINWIPDEEKKEIRFFAQCSDVFYWATADSEEILPEDLPLLQQCWENVTAIDPLRGGWMLATLFAARKRGMRPMRVWFRQQHKISEDPLYPPQHRAQAKLFIELFEACGPERDPATEG